MTFAEWEEERSKLVATIEAAKCAHDASVRLLEALSGDRGDRGSVARYFYDRVDAATLRLLEVLVSFRERLEEHEKRRP